MKHLVQGSAESSFAFLIVFLEDGPMVAQLRAMGAETAVLRAARLRQAHRVAASVVRIASLARAWRADLVFGWMTKAHLYGSPAAKFAGIPVLWYQHGFPTSRNWLDRTATALPAQGILACSQHVADAQGRLRPRRPIRVVYPGVDLELFNPDALATPAEAREKLGLPLDGPLIGIVGRLQRWKGSHVLIEAMPSILSRYPTARCVLVGGRHALEPAYPAQLLRLIEALRLGEHVIIAGQQPNVPEWMQAADVIVHASDNEPFGMVVVEAMALGKPVVASDAGGPAEVVTTGVDGLLTPFEDSAALAAAILRYLDDEDYAARLAANARVTAKKFSTKKYAESFVENVHGILALEKILSVRELTPR